MCHVKVQDIRAYQRGNENCLFAINTNEESKLKTEPFKVRKLNQQHKVAKGINRYDTRIFLSM